MESYLNLTNPSWHDRHFRVIPMSKQSTPQQQLATQSHVLPAQKPRFWFNLTDKRIYELLEEKGPLTRPKLVELTGLPRTTIFDALTRLMIRRLVDKYSEERQSRGRRFVRFEVIAKS
jgi:uncharacterized membrane protein